jgi:hypothetical protein
MSLYVAGVSALKVLAKRLTGRGEGVVQRPLEAQKALNRRCGGGLGVV